MPATAGWPPVRGPAKGVVAWASSATFLLPCQGYGCHSRAGKALLPGAIRPGGSAANSSRFRRRCHCLCVTGTTGRVAGARTSTWRFATNPGRPRHPRTALPAATKRRRLLNKNDNGRISYGDRTEPYCLDPMHASLNITPSEDVEFDGSIIRHRLLGQAELLHHSRSDHCVGSAGVNGGSYHDTVDMKRHAQPACSRVGSIDRNRRFVPRRICPLAPANAI